MPPHRTPEVRLRTARQGHPPILLSDLVSTLPGCTRRGDAPITALSLDSRKIAPGALFVAMPGTRNDGHEFVTEAVGAGAAAVVVERPTDAAVPEAVVPSAQAAIGSLAAKFYGHPSDRLAVVGITGTNGKTTVASTLRQTLDTAGLPAGQVGTVGTYFAGRFERPTLTTPQAPELQETLFRMVEAGVRVATVEASSHGLVQHRIDGTRIELGIFTNLTREHLDYHETMERYYQAKALLFQPQRCASAIVCVDDEWGQRLADEIEIPTTTFGRKPTADICYSVQEDALSGITVDLDGIDGGVRLHARLIGRLNGPDVVAAYLAARNLGVSPATAAAGIAGSAPPPGRFELIDGGQPFLVVIDYAHTPDALAGIICTARTLAGSGGRVTVVAGARGRRDRGKRKEMGKAAVAADQVILTTDSPGDEDPRAIVDDLLDGVRVAESNATIRVELDRRRAVNQAISHSSPGDVVLVVGRGHEVVQHIGNLTVPFDDREVARESLLAFRHHSKAEGSAP